MKKLAEIKAVETIGKDVFFKVEWKEEGESRTETISLETLIELARKRIEFVYDVDNEELEVQIADAGIEYVEIESPLSDDEEGYYVYLHEAKVEDGEVIINFEGVHMQSYKTYRGAMNYSKQVTKIVVG